MGRLFFENSQGIRRAIANNVSLEDCSKEIKKFIDECNKGREENKKFHSYYIRTWEEKDEIIFDVGSHTEFFIWGE